MRSVFFSVCLILFFGRSLFAQGADVIEPSSFQSYVVPSRLDDKLDFIYNTSVQSISLTPISKVYRNEFLTIIKLAVNVAAKDADYAIEDELLLIAPNGSLKVLEAVKRHFGVKKDRALAWSFVMAFDENFELGEYRFVYRCVNLKTGVERVAISSVVLGEWSSANLSPIVDDKTFWQATKLYHTNQSPELLLRIFNSEHCKILNEKKDAINHNIFIFLREAFRQKSFLYDLLARDFDLASNLKRVNTIVLLTALGEAGKIDSKAMTTEEKTLRANVFNMLFSLVSPYENKASSGFQESLWGEFYAKGNYAPIEFLLKCFDDVDGIKDFVKSLKDGKRIDDFEIEYLRSSVRGLSSFYSIMRNADVKLAMRYIEFYAKEHNLSNEKINSAFATVKDYLATRAAQKKAKEASSSNEKK